MTSPVHPSVRSRERVLAIARELEQLRVRQLELERELDALFAPTVPSSPSGSVVDRALALLQQEGAPMTAPEVAARLQVRTLQTARTALQRLLARKAVVRVGRGRYRAR